MIQAEKWQKDLAVYRSINTTFIIEGNVHDLQPFLYEDDGSCEPVSLSLYLHRYLSAVGYDPIVFYNRIDGFSNPYALDMTASFSARPARAKKTPAPLAAQRRQSGQPWVIPLSRPL